MFIFFITEIRVLVHNGYKDAANDDVIPDPPGTRRNSEGQLIDEKTGQFVKDPNTIDYNRNMSERKLYLEMLMIPIVV